VKGGLMKYLYRNFSESDYFVYLDPDTYVYSPFEELYVEWSSSPIILTPHLDVPGNLEMELSSLKHGTFNLGFLALARHVDTEKFLDWWESRLDFACYDDIPSGIFTDQKWLNLAPGFFPVHVLRHPGYNFATWSLMDRQLSVDDAGNYHVNGQRLRFAHFSGYDGGTFHKCIEKWAPNNLTLLTRFAKDYESECRQNQGDVFKNIAWSYEIYSSGKKISRLARLLWRDRRRYDHRNPFGLGNVILLRSLLSLPRLLSTIRRLLHI
jgi:hypothetical protein